MCWKHFPFPPGYLMRLSIVEIDDDVNPLIGRGGELFEYLRIYRRHV